ncbi:hypothetical protein VDG1235_3863 [Verrucomicrobiia bacterium DG1235]|nr:hypothetical protein VDG1235_3863 [Verrucomicrobiae bacterium DG1235]
MKKAYIVLTVVLLAAFLWSFLVSQRDETLAAVAEPTSSEVSSLFGAEAGGSIGCEFRECSEPSRGGL